MIFLNQTPKLKKNQPNKNAEESLFVFLFCFVYFFFAKVHYLSPCSIHNNYICCFVLLTNSLISQLIWVDTPSLPRGAFSAGERHDSAETMSRVWKEGQKVHKEDWIMCVVTPSASMHLSVNMEMNSSTLQFLFSHTVKSKRKSIGNP